MLKEPSPVHYQKTKQNTALTSGDQGKGRGLLGSYGLRKKFSSVARSCLTLSKTMDCSTPGLPVHHQLLEFTQTHVH